MPTSNEIIEALEIAQVDKERRIGFAENQLRTLKVELKQIREGLLRAKKLSD